MSLKATVKSQYHLLERKNPRTGYMDRVVFTGSLRNKPKGWRAIKDVTSTNLY